MRSFARLSVVFAILIVADSARGAISGVTIDLPTLATQIYPRNLHAAPDGRIWFSDERFTPHSVGFFGPDGSVKSYGVPCDGCADASHITYIESITTTADGHAWFLYTRVRSDGSPVDGGLNNYVGRFTPDGVFTSFPVPTKYAFRRFNVGARGQSRIIVGPDGNLWFTENNGNRIGRLTPSGVLTEFTIPSSIDVTAFPENFKTSHPSGIIAGPDGNLWFGEVGTDKIAKITTSGTITEYAAPKNTGPFWFALGTDGNLWFTGQSLFPVVGRIGRVTPAGEVTLYSLGAGNEFPQHITRAADGTLWFTLANGKLGRITLPATPGGSPTFDYHEVPEGYAPFDIVVAAKSSSFSHVPSAQTKPAPPPRSESLEEQDQTKRRAVTPSRVEPFVGQAFLLMTMPLSDANRPQIEAMRSELESAGFAIEGGVLHYPMRAASGYRVEVDGDKAQTLLDGTFTLPFPPRASSLGEIRNHDGSIVRTFAAASALVPRGTPVREPILIELELSDGPNGMNDFASVWEEHQRQLLAPAPAAEKPPDLGFPCASHENCKPAKCPVGRCCLDYNGRCADTPLQRWDDCALRLQQYTLSTCSWWVNTGCCTNENAVVRVIGVSGPGCYDNHRGRECQNLDASTLGLQLTTGEVVANVPAPDPRTLREPERQITYNENVNVPCGGTVQVQLHNNTCANDTEVTFNGFLERYSCLAGGSVSHSGTIPMFSQIAFVTSSTEETAAYRYIQDFSILYTAPSAISACGGVGVDVLKATAGGMQRTVTFNVDCSRGVTATPNAIATPVFDPPPGAYPDGEFNQALVVAISSATPGVEIHYTTDGTNPTILSPDILNGGGLMIRKSQTLKARAFKRSTGEASFIQSGDYEILRRVTPAISPNPAPEGQPPQTYPCDPLPVRIKALPLKVEGEESSRIAYTVDGTEPKESDAEATEEVSFTLAPPGTITVTAKAWRKFRYPTTTQAVYRFNCREPSVELFISAADRDFRDRLLRATVASPPPP